MATAASAFFLPITGSSFLSLRFSFVLAAASAASDWHSNRWFIGWISFQIFKKIEFIFRKISRTMCGSFHVRQNTDGRNLNIQIENKKMKIRRVYLFIYFIGANDDDGDDIIFSPAPAQWNQIRWPAKEERPKEEQTNRSDESSQHEKLKAGKATVGLQLIRPADVTPMSLIEIKLVANRLA